MNLDPLGSLFAAVLVLLLGALLNRKVGVLARYNIPEPITGGLLFAAVAAVVSATAGFKVSIDQTIKPLLLLMFFAGVGMCADLRMLGRGGKALVIFLLVLFPYILVQNGVGVAMATSGRVRASHAGSTPFLSTWPRLSFNFWVSSRRRRAAGLAGFPAVDRPMRPLTFESRM